MTRSDFRLFKGCDAICDAVNAGMLSWDARCERQASPLVGLAFQRCGEIQAMSMAGEPVIATRGRRQLAQDGGAYLGVLFQRTGRTICAQEDRQTVAEPGDIMIWHSAKPIDFIMPEPFLKLCLLIPVARVGGDVANSMTYDGMHFRAGANVTSVLAACLTTLADEIVAKDGDPIESAMDIVIETITAGIRAAGRAQLPGRRSSLFARITASMDRAIGDPRLTPAAIARAHNISVRYLHLLFSERGTTVGGWIRSRRLERARAQLCRRACDRSMTEIALEHGFSDAAHFSRCFKTAYGVPPGEFRRRTSEGTLSN